MNAYIWLWTDLIDAKTQFCENYSETRICFQFENGPKAELLFSGQEYEGRLSKLRCKTAK